MRAFPRRTVFEYIVHDEKSESAALQPHARETALRPAAAGRDPVLAPAGVAARAGPGPGRAGARRGVRRSTCVDLPSGESGAHKADGAIEFFFYVLSGSLDLTVDGARHAAGARRLRPRAAEQ